MTIKRNKDSHKGENGRVLIVGGNELYHGAPLLAGLGAEKSGADLVYLMVPNNQLTLARQYSLNLIVDTFAGKFLKASDVKKVVDWSQKVDVLVLGNGLGEKAQTIRACKKIIQKTKCHLVIDASALTALAQIDDLASHERQIVMTPHRGEFARLLGKDIEIFSKKELNELLKEKAQDFGATIVLKGPEDYIVSSDGKITINKTGHPIMSKGGTGDFLAGIIGGLMAQGLSGLDAAQKATEMWGMVGSEIFKKEGLMTPLQNLIDNYPQPK